MKFIIDPASITQTDSVKAHPNRLYRCEPCNLDCIRKDVRKDADGVYHCPRCDQQITDITDTGDGQNLATILGL